jgi:hypothetical protein
MRFRKHLTSFSKTLHYRIGMVISVSLIIACSDLSNKSVNGDIYNVTKVEGSQNLYLETKNFSGSIFSANRKMYNDIFRRFTPSIDETFKAEKIFERCLALREKDSNGIVVDKKMLKPLPDYYRQYIGFYNEKGEKVIYFNCFTKNLTGDDNNWKKEELMIMDGGNNYFSILINLQIEGCSLFMVHGRA